MIIIEMRPDAGANTSKSTTLRVFLGRTEKVTRDAVQAKTIVVASGAPSAASS